MSLSLVFLQRRFFEDELLIMSDTIDSPGPYITVRKEFLETWIWDGFNDVGLVTLMISIRIVLKTQRILFCNLQLHLSYGSIIFLL